MSIRLANPGTDVRSIADVVNAYELAPVEIDMVKQWFDYMPPGRIAHRTVATDEAGLVVGYGAAVHEAWWPEGEFYVWVGLLPEARGRGLGRRLAEDAQLFLKQRGASLLTSEVRDDDPVSQRFARHNGFEVTSHTFSSFLSTEAFDETPFRATLAGVEFQGIRVCSVADFGDGPEARRALHEVNALTSRDIPGNEGPDMPFDVFETWICGSDWYRPAGQLIAVDKARWVGVCAVQLLPQSQKAYNVMTGVLREYRGRGIALALKIMAIRYAREHGARVLYTSNASNNAAMVALNRKLGYQPQPGKYLLAKSVIEAQTSVAQVEA
ncbi:MAG: GNAT family N-acetyltransferase [Candidatus Eisenbacteria bacterium]|jgi:GNAT superfamily N-acetyltransferase|nr:GNAT family N-acetyltransferase [Candidatus Eisenbacteria bacterium]